MAVTLNASTSSGLVQTADTSGTVEIQSNGTTKFTVATTGAYGQLVQGTAQTASGSSVDFTGIPSWVKRITVTFTELSFAAAGVARIRLGTSGGLVTTGYIGTTYGFNTTPTISATGLNASPEGIAGIPTGAAATTVVGQFIITNITGNTWQCSGAVARLGDTATNSSIGSIALSGTLDRLSVVATTSTFDAGTINILYEG